MDGNTERREGLRTTRNVAVGRVIDTEKEGLREWDRNWNRMAL